MLLIGVVLVVMVLGGVVDWLSALVSINEVALHRARLLLGWVTVCRLVKHLGV